MSVVAWDGKRIAADTFSCYGNIKHSTTKLWRLSNGWFLGVVGEVSEGIAVKEYYESWIRHGVFPTVKPTFKDSTCLLVQGDNAWTVETENIKEVPITLPFFAIGSGKDMAMGAMGAGKTAYQAVEITAQFHTEVSMPITLFEIPNCDDIPF